MAIVFKPLDRSNFAAMLRLKVHPEQATFVAQPSKSIAICYTRAFGDDFDHVPHVIFDDEVAVGYVTIACNPSSRDDYWIDDIMIDASHQGRGHGRVAIEMTIRMILARYPQCETIQLTCFEGNDVAARIYEALGFRRTGKLNEEYGEPEYALIAPAIDRFR